MRLQILCLWIFITSVAFAGPIVPSRSYILAPKMREKSDTTKGVKFLRQNGLWGNLARGYGSTDERYAWSVSFGGIIQFAEWENSSIYLQGDVDVLADTYNDISFNPRSIFWTEGVIYGMRLSEKKDLHVGYIHRCKHDIDNSGNNEVGANEERTLIYGSLQGKFISTDFPTPSSIITESADLSATLDYYLVKQDYRFPQEFTDSGNSVEDMTFSFNLSTKLHHALISGALLYSRVALTFSVYNWFDNIVTEARAELGIELKGESTTMDIFAGFEGLEDDMTRPAPVKSNYWYLGIRFIGNSIGL